MILLRLVADFKDGDELCLPGQSENEESNGVLAKAGDIVIVRVGRGCVGKSALIKEGHALISDCLYVISAENNIIRSIWEFLKSAEGKAWIKAYSHGVCSKVLSKADILNIPIK